jgi:hypothetical protein
LRTIELKKIQYGSNITILTKMLFCFQLSSLHLLIVFSLAKFQCVRTFNFDLHTPILIHDAFDKEESHFGASLTLVGTKGGPGW